MTGALIIISFIGMVLFIPNGNEMLSPFDKFMQNRQNKNKIKLSSEKEGDIPFILELVNNHINRYNMRTIEFGLSTELTPEVTDIDPYSKFTFHGACRNCPVPYLESISGCSACSYAVENGGFDRSNNSEELIQLGIDAKNKRLDEVAIANKENIPFILKMVFLNFL